MKHIEKIEINTNKFSGIEMILAMALNELVDAHNSLSHDTEERKMKCPYSDCPKVHYRECPIHGITPPPQEWEEEKGYDECFDENGYPNEKLKPFISKLLAKERKRIKEKIEELLPESTYSQSDYSWLKDSLFALLSEN